MSCLTLSSHLYLGLPYDLLVTGFHLNIFLTVLLSGILCTWPKQHSLSALICLNIFLCFIDLSNVPQKAAFTKLFRRSVFSKEEVWIKSHLMIDGIYFNLISYDVTMVVSNYLKKDDLKLFFIERLCWKDFFCFWFSDTRC
jgi:hypothetical protein